MKPLISVCTLFLLGLLTACSDDGACKSDYNGTWNGTSQADSYVGTDACSFVYNGVGGCVSTGTYTPAFKAAGGSVAVNIATKTGSGSCIATGTTTCTYSFANATHATLDCGAGSLNYTKQ